MEAPSVDMHSKRILPTGLSVSKKTIRSAMDCRQRFQYHTERNPMYRGTVHPWDMVGRLADRLMIQLLKEMTEEARLDTLIKDIYSLEFQGK
ncbi:hypothetical protein C0J52_08447 [Blattella germanica]|nr:hypothetical protein C0J52_08447 [Blattella germanica]